MGERKRFIGVQHSLVRSAIQSGILTGGLRFVADFGSRMEREHVPTSNRLEALAYLDDLTEVLGMAGGKPAVPSPVSSVKPSEGVPSKEKEAAAAEELLSALDDDDGFGFTPGPEPEPVGSKLVRAVREVAAAWTATCASPKFLWKSFDLDGQAYYLASSWRLRAPGYEWNLTGTTGNNPVLHRCGPDVLNFEAESAVSYVADLEMDWNISKQFDSLLKGTTQHVQATVFVWLVKYVAHREFRFWLNEKRSSPPTGVKPAQDIWTRRVVMTPLAGKVGAK